MRYGLKGLLRFIMPEQCEPLQDEELKGLPLTYFKKDIRYNSQLGKYEETTMEVAQQYYAKIDIKDFEYAKEKYSVLSYTIYKLDTMQPHLSIYVMDSKTLTYVHYDTRWSGAKLSHFNLYSLWRYHNSVEVIAINEKSYPELCKIYTFFDKKENQIENLIERLVKLQENQSERDLKAKHDRIKRIIDAEFMGLPELPRDLADFANNKVLTMPGARVIIYERGKKGVAIGKCSYCGETMSLGKVHHGYVSQCPHCKSAVTLLSKGKAAQNAKVRDYLQVLQKYDDKLIIRYFKASRCFSNKYTKIDDNIYEINRVVINLNKTKELGLRAQMYCYDNFMQTGEQRWCRNDIYSDYSSSRKTKVYSKGVSRVLDDTLLKYSGLKLLLKKAPKLSVYKFICNAYHLPKIELLIKSRLYKLVEEMVATLNVGNNERICDELFKNKHQLKKLQYMNLGIDGIKYYFKLIDNKKNVDIKLFKYLDSNNKINSFYLDNLLKYVSINKLAKYAKQQRLQLNDWLDYIGECEKLGYNLKDTQIITPKHFYATHERLSRIIAEMVETQNQEKYFAVIKKYYGLEYNNAKFSVILPKKSSDIVIEGKVQHHCVGGYVSKVLSEHSLIFFIRKNSEIDKAYYTLELNAITFEVKQCRGYRNDFQRGGQAEPEALKFVEEWKRKVVDKFKEEFIKTETKVKAS